MKKPLLALFTILVLTLTWYWTRPSSLPAPVVAVTPTPICSTWTFTVTNQNTTHPQGNFTFHACSQDMGRRFHFCFTGTSGNLTHTTCLPVTVLGSCTPDTADVNADGKVDLADIGLLAGKYDRADANLDILNRGRVDILDVACAAFYYGQIAS